jgi:arylsulfatase A-like enzyme
VNPIRNVLYGLAGGLLSGSVVGLVEAVYLLVTQGAPDLLSPLYAVVLYGGIGMGLGLGGGIALQGLQRAGLFGEADDALRFGFGSAGAFVPMLLFIGMYLGNKVLYAEQGVPLTGKLTLLGLVGALGVLEITAGRTLLRGRAGILLKPVGVVGIWAAMAAVTGLLSFIPTGADPRASFHSGKPVPAGMLDNPNVLILTIDTLRADYLGTYGKAGDPTPVIDGIAADGIVFENFFGQASWTRSSFASLWTSRIPSSHNTDTKAARMPDDLKLLSEVLQEAGVTTGNLANNINVTSTFNFDQGWDTFLYESPDYSFGATESVFSLTFYKVVHKLNEKLGGAKHVSSFYQPIEVVADDAKAFIQANGKARWMLGMHLMEPHDPYFEHPYLDGTGSAEFNGVGFARAEVESPELGQAEYLKRVYLHEIIHMDKKLADFVAWMKSSGVYDETLIVITADHGEEFGEHGGFWHGTTLYDEQVHIPLIVKLPKSKHAGTRVTWTARTIDVAPTIVGQMGIRPSSQWEGTDLLKRVEAELDEIETRKKARAELVQEIDALQAVIASGTEDTEAVGRIQAAQAKLTSLDAGDPACAPYKNKRDLTVISEEDFEGNIVSAIREGGFKFIRANEGNARGLPIEELFDVAADPGETENLVGSDAERCGAHTSDLPRTMDAKMDGSITEALSRAIDGGSAETSAAETQHLCALGYIQGEDCD